MGHNKKTSYGARAVVTGAGSGIGRAFALELAERNSMVVCSDINLPAAEETVDLVAKAGGKAIAVATDVTSEESVRALAAAAQDWFGLPTLVINNAGIGGGGDPIGEGELSAWRRILEVNLWGVIFGCHIFLPLIKQAGRGGVINIASAAAFAAGPEMGSYNVSKSGVLTLTETMATELARTDIDVTVVCPSFVPTNIFDSDLIRPDAAERARALAKRNGSTAESVALAALDALDRGRLHVLPQTEAKFIWRLKRLAPGTYPRLANRILGRAAQR